MNNLSKKDYLSIPKSENENRDQTMSNPGLQIWKPTRNGGEWARMDEIEEGIRVKLKPENGFQTMIGQLKYSVKINPDNSIFCFRNQSKSKRDQRSDLNQSNKPQTYFQLQKDVNPIENIKVIPLDDFQNVYLKDQWQISEVNHISIIENKPHVVLIRRRTISKVENEKTNNEEVIN